MSDRATLTLDYFKKDEKLVEEVMGQEPEEA